MIAVIGPNATVLAADSSDGIIMVDGGHASWSEALLSAVADQFPSRPVGTLFNTHWHTEQTGSNLTLGEQGAEIIAHENTGLWLGTEVWVRWATRNAQDAVSMVQTAEGALVEVHSMLQRIRELAVQYANGTNDADSQASIEAEVTELHAAIADIALNTKFNGVELLTGGADVDFQVGADSGQTLTVTFGDVDVSGAVVTDIDSVDTEIAAISTLRGTFGAAQNRLEHTVNSLAVAAENMAASESRIRDVDVAAEMVNFTRAQILQQAGTAILAQANQAPQAILALLR
jgi:flagellin